MCKIRYMSEDVIDSFSSNSFKKSKASIYPRTSGEVVLKLLEILQDAWGETEVSEMKKQTQREKQTADTWLVCSATLCYP
jgi:hypothetical protein